MYLVPAYTAERITAAAAPRSTPPPSRPRDRVSRPSVWPEHHSFNSKPPRRNRPPNPHARAMVYYVSVCAHSIDMRCSLPPSRGVELIPSLAPLIAPQVCPNCGHRSAEYSDSMVHCTSHTAHSTLPPSLLGAGPMQELASGPFVPPPARPGLLFPPAASLRGRRCTQRPSHTSSKAIQCMLTRSHPLVSADNACTVVRERPALNVTPLGGRSATDPGPSTTGGGLLFEGQAGAPKLGDPSVLGGAGAGGRDDTAGSGQSPPGGGGDATFNGATAQQS